MEAPVSLGTRFVVRGCTTKVPSQFLQAALPHTQAGSAGAPGFLVHGPGHWGPLSGWLSCFASPGWFVYYPWGLFRGPPSLGGLSSQEFHISHDGSDLGTVSQSGPRLGKVVIGLLWSRGGVHPLPAPFVSLYKRAPSPCLHATKFENPCWHRLARSDSTSVGILVSFRVYNVNEKIIHPHLLKHGEAGFIQDHRGRCSHQGNGCCRGAGRNGAQL